jgi:hypothetical protein
MLIQRFTPTYILKAQLLQFQNMYAMCVLSCVMKSLLDFYVNDNYESIIDSYRLIAYYVTFDMLFCEKIMYLHHAFCWVLAYSYFNNLEASYESKDFCTLILTTEVSTYFLTLRAMLEESKHSHIYTKRAYDVLSVIFSITFFYFRFYVYINALQMEQYKVFLSTMTWFDRVALQIGLNGLLLLNVYWGRLILKLCYRMVYPKKRDERVIE